MDLPAKSNAFYMRYRKSIPLLPSAHFTYIYNEVTISNCTPKGYTFNHKARQARRGGGVGLLFKSSLTVRRESVAHYKSFEALRVLVSCDFRSIVLIIIYRPDTVDEHGQRILFSTFLEEFTSLLDTLVLHPSQVVLTGDFNQSGHSNDSHAQQFTFHLWNEAARHWRNSFTWTHT